MHRDDRKGFGLHRHRGSTVAARLSEEHGTRVLLLGAGGWDCSAVFSVPAGEEEAVGNPAYTWGCRTEPDATRRGKTERWGTAGLRASGENTTVATNAVSGEAPATRSGQFARAASRFGIPGLMMISEPTTGPIVVAFRSAKKTSRHTGSIYKATGGKVAARSQGRPEPCPDALSCLPAPK